MLVRPYFYDENQVNPHTIYWPTAVEHLSEQQTGKLFYNKKKTFYNLKKKINFYGKKKRQNCQNKQKLNCKKIKNNQKELNI